MTCPTKRSCFYLADFYICGDFNAHYGDMADFTEGVDQLPERQVLDFTLNGYSDLFIDFLINVNCCIVNGRNSTEIILLCQHAVARLLITVKIIKLFSTIESLESCLKGQGYIDHAYDQFCSTVKESINTDLQKML